MKRIQLTFLIKDEIVERQFTDAILSALFKFTFCGERDAFQYKINTIEEIKDKNIEYVCLSEKIKDV